MPCRCMMSEHGLTIAPPASPPFTTVAQERCLRCRLLPQFRGRALYCDVCALARTMPVATAEAGSSAVAATA